MTEHPWSFRARPAANPTIGRKFIAWCARLPVDQLGNSPLDVPWREECRVEYGDTALEALARLGEEVLREADHADGD